MSGWIPVSERMPTDSGPYLVYKKNSAYQFGIYDWSRSDGAWIPELMRKKRSESTPKTWVTHWQPMPAAPDE